MGKATGEPAKEPGAGNRCPACGYNLRAAYAEKPIRAKLLRRIASGNICGHAKHMKCPECDHRWNAPCLATPMGPNLPCRGHSRNIKNMFEQTKIETGTDASPALIYRNILASYMDTVPASLLLELTAGTDSTLDNEIGLLRLRLIVLQGQYTKGHVNEERYHTALNTLLSQLEKLVSANIRNRLNLIKIEKLEGGTQELDLWDPADG